MNTRLLLFILTMLFLICWVPAQFIKFKLLSLNPYLNSRELNFMQYENGYLFGVAKNKGSSSKHLYLFRIEKTGKTLLHRIQEKVHINYMSPVGENGTAYIAASDTNAPYDTKAAAYIYKFEDGGCTLEQKVLSGAQYLDRRGLFTKHDNKDISYNLNILTPPPLSSSASGSKPYDFVSKNGQIKISFKKEGLSLEKNKVLQTIPYPESAGNFNDFIGFEPAIIGIDPQGDRFLARIGPFYAQKEEQKNVLMEYDNGTWQPYPLNLVHDVKNRSIKAANLFELCYKNKKSPVTDIVPNNICSCFEQHNIRSQIKKAKSDSEFFQDFIKGFPIHFETMSPSEQANYLHRNFIHIKAPDAKIFTLSSDNTEVSFYKTSILPNSDSKGSPLIQRSKPFKEIRCTLETYLYDMLNLKEKLAPYEVLTFRPDPKLKKFFLVVKHKENNQVYGLLIELDPIEVIELPSESQHYQIIACQNRKKIGIHNLNQSQEKYYAYLRGQWHLLEGSDENSHPNQHNELYELIDISPKEDHLLIHYSHRSGKEHYESYMIHPALESTDSTLEGKDLQEPSIIENNPIELPLPPIQNNLNARFLIEPNKFSPCSNLIVGTFHCCANQKKTHSLRSSRSEIVSDPDSYDQACFWENIANKWTCKLLPKQPETRFSKALASSLNGSIFAGQSSTSAKGWKKNSAQLKACFWNKEQNNSYTLQYLPSIKFMPHPKTRSMTPVAHIPAKHESISENNPKEMDEAEISKATFASSDGSVLGGESGNYAVLWNIEPTTGRLIQFDILPNTEKQLGEASFEGGSLSGKAFFGKIDHKPCVWIKKKKRINQTSHQKHQEKMTSEDPMIYLNPKNQQHYSCIHLEEVLQNEGIDLCKPIMPTQIFHISEDCKTILFSAKYQTKTKDNLDSKKVLCSITLDQPLYKI